MDQTDEFAASLLIVRQAANIKDESEFKGGNQRSQADLIHGRGNVTVYFDLN